jgi:hypothetical protein
MKKYIHKYIKIIKYWHNFTLRSGLLSNPPGRAQVRLVPPPIASVAQSLIYGNINTNIVINKVVSQK